MANSRFLMHSTENCKFCTLAKAVFQAYGIEYTTVHEKSPEWPTYPCIYYLKEEGEHVLIGGTSELQSFLTTYNKDKLKNQADG